jgi:hypothetical protein
MKPGIEKIDLHIQLRDPTEPEVWVGVVANGASASTEVRGRLMGPRCRYSTTVEVAYPFRPAPRPPQGLEGVPRRAIIPEASAWEPTHPFLYEGPVELWDNDQRLDENVVRCGIRYLHLGSRGFRLNGRLYALRGLLRDQCPTGEMADLREQGVNLLVTEVDRSSEQLWVDADEVGMLVLGRVSASAESIERACSRQSHPANVGWLLASTIFEDASLRAFATPLLERRGGELIGIASADVEGRSSEAQFCFGGERGGEGLPWLALTSEDLPETPGLIGTVRP